MLILEMEYMPMEDTLDALLIKTNLRGLEAFLQWPLISINSSLAVFDHNVSPRFSLIHPSQEGDVC